MEASEQPGTAAESWFAVRVKPRAEKSVSRALLAKGYREFLPTYTTRSRWADRYKRIERPLFPGYLFCRFDPKQRVRILETPGVASIIGFGNQPAPVDEEVIRGIHAIVASGLPVAPHLRLEVGRTVQLCAGPLSGLTGTLIKFRNIDRLVVTVELLHRSVAVEIDRSWIAPVVSSGVWMETTAN
jgi:transcription antitermination factor NusG